MTADGRSMQLFAFSGGFLGPSAQARRVRRILTLASHPLRLGWPSADDAVAAWGHSPRAARAEAVARRTGAAIWRIEDAFLRSVRPGRLGGEPPMGLLIDRLGAHYDPSQPSELERLLATHPLDDTPLLNRARHCIWRLRHLHLSKYNVHDPALTPPPPGYVLVIDQVRGDASIRHGGVNGPLSERLFTDMLHAALDENPGARVILRTHPESAGKARAGHFTRSVLGNRIQIADGGLSPWALLEGAIAVYTVSSQMGFEAILAGHRPRVFGLPFYAGWGLSQDEQSLKRRDRRLTQAQLFAAAMLLYPAWHDPLRDRPCALEQVVDQMEARIAVFQQDRRGHVACGMRLWKRRHLQAMFGREKALIFERDETRAQTRAKAAGRGLIGWASRVSPGFPGLRIEDGFLRSRGLGAALTPPVSLVADDLGIYYDPARESRLERLVAEPLPPGGAARVQALIDAIVAGGLTKYNIGATADTTWQAIAGLRQARPDVPVILVPGQVEDDASIRLGAAEIRTNRALLEAARAALPEAIILFKPHPDIEAGLRPGAVPDADDWANLVVEGMDAASLLPLVDRVWTITSGLGFEALLRGKAVTCLGVPFYAGWGLTDDRAPTPPRRRAAAPVTLAALVHAALIAYPRYIDPATGTACPPEFIVERLSGAYTDTPTGVMTGKQAGGAGPGLRLLARVQGTLASRAHWWR